MKSPMVFKEIYDALNSSTVDHYQGNLDMRKSIHQIFSTIPMVDLMQMTSIEIIQEGRIIEQFDLPPITKWKVNPLEIELHCIGNIHLPIFTVYITDTVSR
jgi:hypothetical protein